MKRFLALTLTLVLLIASSVVTVSAAASTTPPVAANYKGVVFYVQNNIFQLCPEGFSLNFGTPDGLSEKKGASCMHLPYVWQENCPEYIKLPTDKATFIADMKVAPRYFRVNLKKADKIGSKAESNFKFATGRGDAPGFYFAWDTLPICPTNTTKIFFDSWIQDYAMTNKYPKTDYVNQAALYVKQLDKMYAAIVKPRPKAKLYVSSMGLICETFPRIDNPKLMTDAMLAKWATFIGYLGSFKTKVALNVPFRKEINKQLQALCKTKGYIYVNLEKAGMTNKDGLFLEKYAHVNAVGAQFNQAGVTLFGDYVCKVMGLKTAKQMYNLK